MLLGVLSQGYCGMHANLSLGSWQRSLDKSMRLTSRRRFLRGGFSSTTIHIKGKVSDINWFQTFHGVSLGCYPNTASCSNLLC